MESLGVYSLNKKPIINGGSTVSRPNPYVIDVDAVAIFSITATITNLMTVSRRRDRSYIVLPDQLTLNQKNLPPTKKRTNRMLRGLHHNSRVRKTPQTTLIYYRRRSRHEPLTGLESREIQTRSQESYKYQIS